MINPVKAIREDHKLTQKDLAVRSGVTAQVVTKTEKGIYPEIPPNISKALVTLTGKSSLELTDEYEAWISYKLRSVRLPTEYVPFSTPQEMKVFREEVCKINNVPNTIISFCSLLSIHPFVIEKYEKGRMKETPKQLMERVDEICQLNKSS